jgi:hypothetical protein
METPLQVEFIAAVLFTMKTRSILTQIQHWNLTLIKHLFSIENLQKLYSLHIIYTI